MAEVRFETRAFQMQDGGWAGQILATAPGGTKVTWQSLPPHGGFDTEQAAHECAYDVLSCDLNAKLRGPGAGATYFPEALLGE